MAEVGTALTGGIVEAVERILDHVEAVEPEILALLPEPGRRERLVAEARALELRYPSPAARPPLFGALVGVKDLFSARGFETRAGSRLPASLFAMYEASSLTALKKAGALVLGKTVSTEFAYFAPGPTRNPLDHARTPGGSSSGSAAAVAAGFCHLALGTQTIGSISRPAAYCGIAGYKPSYGLVRADGVVPFSPSLDHVGLLARDVATLATGAAALVSGLAPNVGRGSPTFARLALAVPEGPYLSQAETVAREAFELTLARLEGFGCRITRVRVFPDIDEINERHRRIAAAELAIVHRVWFADYRELYARETSELIEKGKRIGPETLTEDLGGRAALRARLDAALAEAGACAWISPSAMGPAPRGLGATGSPLMNLPWTHAGVPTLAIPSGELADAMPLGIQLATPFGTDAALFAVGREIEGYLTR